MSLLNRGVTLPGLKGTRKENSLQPVRSDETATVGSHLRRPVTLRDDDMLNLALLMCGLTDYL